MPLGLHHNFNEGQIHSLFNWLPADATELAAIVPTSDDDGKCAWQLDADKFWVLIDYSGPTWKLLGSGATPAAHASTHAAAGSDPLTLTMAQISDAGNLATADVVTVADMDAEASTSGQVPTSDGAGGVTWQDQTGSAGGSADDRDAWLFG